jgi:wyosine [tRNA(Phe)-imidazoG37] synthetase (radical SAM superfamily)
MQSIWRISGSGAEEWILGAVRITDELFWVACFFMTTRKFKYIYGPVHSWRLGISLGIDPISQPDKICNLDCVYCQLGPTDGLALERQIFVPTDKIVSEITSLPPMKLDYLTFSGRGEPTLAKNLGAMIHALRLVRREKIAVITNSVLMSQPDVRADLALADFVVAKLDGCSVETYGCVNRPLQAQLFSAVVEGLHLFRAEFNGKLDLQIMFIDANQAMATEMAELARAIRPDEIEINTPLRPSAVRPLEETQLNEIKKAFHGLSVKTVYEVQRKNIEAMDQRATVKRHGRYHETR